MNKKLIKLTEIDLHRIVKESAQKILNEIGDTPRGQFALGAVAARAGHRMFNSKSDRERDYWNNVENHAAEIGHNNVNPEWDDETEYFDNGIDYWQDNMRQYESKNTNNDLIRLTESDLHKIVKESVNKILNEIGDTPKGQYMLGRLQTRQLKNRDSSAAKTSKYASSKWGDMNKDRDNYENQSYANLIGHTDEKYSKELPQNRIGNYQRKFRNDHLNGISKF